MKYTEKNDSLKPQRVSTFFMKENYTHINNISAAGKSLTNSTFMICCGL